MAGDVVDLRLLRYFTVVAEHGNIGQAAEALHLAQPSLSRQIQRLENQVGARLLERTARGSTLTAAGRALLRQAGELLGHAERVVADARAATDPERIAVGHVGNLIVTPVVLELRRRHPEAGIRTVAVDGLRPVDALLDRQVDALMARHPVTGEGLCVDVLYEEPRVLVVPVGHRLAGRDAVRLADFADEPLVRTADETMNAWWRIDPRPDGRPAPGGPLMRAFGDKFELVAGGEALIVLPAGPASTGFRTDLVQVPITDVAPTPVVLVTRSGPTTPLVAEARELATELLSPSRRAS